MSNTQDIKPRELRRLYRDVQLEVLRLRALSFQTDGTKESLRLLEQYENDLKQRLIKCKEDI